ncbi:MAG: S9 family peptidase [Gemmatimonadota bacterium]|nr:S9 family peptidase [Gemmatimonadota bacterium]
MSLRPSFAPAVAATRHWIGVAALLPLSLYAQGPKAPRPMELKDWYRVATLSQPAISPDGKRVAVTVTTVREADNKRHQEIWVVPTDGGPAQRWTSPGTESSAPRWSPDGSWLLFSSTRPGGELRGPGTAWALRADAPGGEAIQTRAYPAGSVPASGRFAVWSEALPADTATTRDDPYARMGPMSRPPFDAITRPADPARYDGRHVVDMTYKSNERGFVPGRRTARTWRPLQVWSQVLGDTARTQLTTAAYSHRGATVSPDGQWIAFVADAALRPDSVVELERDSLARLPYDRARDEAERNDADVYVMPATGGAPRKVATWMGSESDLAWSPDSRRIAFVGRPGRTKSARVYVVAAAGGTPINLIRAWSYEPSNIEWLPNGALQFSAEVGGRTGLFRADAAGRQPPRELLGGRRRMSGFSYDSAGARVAWVATSLTAPTELYVAGADGSGERKLTGFNDALNAEVAWADAERFTYRSVGDLEIEAWLMKPYGYQPGRKYPLVLYIHGGPHSAYGENWFDEFQNLAAMGMWVLFTNPRGSSGYGADFTYSTRGRWGLEDYDDLMKAVEIVSKRPDVDAARLGATGGSYGGFMTTWMATKTNAFKAIQTDRTITDWTYWYGASDAQGLTEFEFFGKPWDNQTLYDTLSPIRYVQKVRTPMLIVQSEEDHRTPMGSAEMWFMSLKKQGVPVELVRYPRSNHDLSRAGEPWLLVDRLGRLRQWFSYWLQDARPGRTAAAGPQ